MTPTHVHRLSQPTHAQLVLELPLDIYTANPWEIRRFIGYMTISRLQGPMAIHWVLPAAEGRDSTTPSPALQMSRLPHAQTSYHHCWSIPEPASMQEVGQVPHMDQDVAYEQSLVC